MKKISLKIISLLVITSSVIAACQKADAVLFEDQSTVSKADKSTWTATADSETNPGQENTGFASATIDGDFNTYWHTAYSTVVPYPHWVLIDMKTEQNMISVEIANRQAGTAGNTNGMKKFRLEGSKDGTTFTSLGEFPFAITNSPQGFPVSSATAYRYLKVTALEAQRAATNHTFLAEIDVFTTKQ
jgi:hypothetical protein